MARVILAIMGLVLLGVGIWLMLHWWSSVVTVLLALMALGVTVCGLVMVIFGISEIAGARPARERDAPPAEEGA